QDAEHKESPHLVAADELVWLGQRLDRVPRGLESTLRDEHLLRRILGPARMVLDGRLELGMNAGLLQDRLELLGFGDVLGERDLNHVRHRAVSSVTGTGLWR